MVRVSIKLGYIIPTFEEIVKLGDMGLNGGKEPAVRCSVARTQLQLLKPTSELFLGHPSGIFLDVFRDILLQRIWDLLDLVVLEQPFIAAPTPETCGVPSSSLRSGVKRIRPQEDPKERTPPAH